jgi:hypothetical protein
MTDSIDNAIASYREAVTDAIYPLQTTREVKVDEFVRLEKAAAALAVLLKGHDLVPKSALRELWGTVQVLRNEAPYFGGERDRLESVASKVEEYFGCILVDELPEDRVTGVPRVI